MLTKEEQAIVRQFMYLRIPEIYKLDDTDNILYIEHISMDICPSLLRKKVRNIDVAEERLLYSQFLSSVAISEFDIYAYQHFEQLKSVLAILFSHCT